MMDSSRKAYAGAMLALAAFGWGLAPVFIRYLDRSYDPYTQNVLRYGSAAVPLALFCLVYLRGPFRAALFDFRGVFGIALLNLVQQTTWTIGTVGATATTAQLIVKLSIVFVIVFGFLLFREERGVIRSRLYQVGTLLSFVGAAAIVSRDRSSIMPRLDMPTLLLLLTAALWGGYAVWAKHLVSRLDPIAMFAAMALYDTIGFVMLSFWLGTPVALVSAGPRMAFIGFVSGIIPIALAHPAFFYAQKHLGAAFCASVALLNPLVTNAFALALWPDERLIPTQWFGTFLLLAGTFLVVRAGRSVRSASTAPDAP